MKKLLFISLLFSLGALSQTSDPLRVNDSVSTSRILIVNSFDAQATNYRKNKKELFAQLADSLTRLLQNQVEPTFRKGVIIYPGLFAGIGNRDSSIVKLMADQGASTAIVIKDLDVYFAVTSSETTKDGSAMSTKTSYDICSSVNYALFNLDGKLKESKIGICESYTERNSDGLLGMLTIGPDIVGKRKDAFKAIEKNAARLFVPAGTPFFPNESDVNRLQKVKPADTILKYSLSFADQAQLMYDGTRLKTYINQPFVEAGDVSHYNGKYFNSKMRYLFAQGELPGWASEDIGFASIVDKATNKPDPKYALAYDNYMRTYSRLLTSVGILFQTRGFFVQAEQLMTKAMKMRKEWFGENSREYINSLHNFAVLKKDIGLYDEAESIFNGLVPVFKQMFTDSSSQYVGILNNKAMLLAELGRTKEAIQLLDEALKIGANILSPSYFDYERILTNRAILEQEAGDLDKAEADYLQALANMEMKGFDDHPDYNNVMVYYGSLKVAKNDPGVLEYLLKTTGKVKKRYGENHPVTAKALKNTADYYLNLKSYGNARDIYRQIAEIQSKVLGEKHKDYLNSLVKLAVCEWMLHENENAYSHFKKAIRNYLFIVNTFFRSMSESEKTVFWRTLKPDIDTYLAFVVETGQADPHRLNEAYDLQLKTKGILINSTKQLKNLILNSKDSTTKRLYEEWLNLKNTLSAYYSSPLEDLKEDKIDLAALERHANDLEKNLSARSSQFNAAYLPPDISFDDVRGKLDRQESAVEIIRVFHYYGDKKGQSEYIALVAKKDSSSPRLVQLGRGNDFEQKNLAQYKRSIKDKTSDTLSYAIYWQPLESAIGDQKTVYVSVDGVYNSINLNTLRKNDDTYLVDHYNIILVPNTRSILSLRSRTLPGDKTNALLLGFPIYGNDDVIPPLPETKEEIQRIDELLVHDDVRTKVFIEQDASEANIKSSSHPSILHIATHGFFRADVDLTKSMSMGVQVSRAKDNALLRSGLLFNGAAAVFSNEPVLDGSDNGVLYAYEAMNLDLQGTELVVLSACETGLGEIVNGEGVYGLSRSFQVAGADKILMSLWKVDDKPTKELMILFYQNWLRLNDPQKAFVEAQKSMKEKYPHPFYWGGFILLN